MANISKKAKKEQPETVSELSGCNAEYNSANLHTESITQNKEEVNPDAEERFSVFSDKFRSELRELLERYDAEIQYLEVDYCECTSNMAFKANAYEIIIDVR